jgi:hypothetical protein
MGVGTKRSTLRAGLTPITKEVHVRQSVRCIALALFSAAAVSFGAQSASAGLLDGGWGCGCGGYGYAQAYVAPVPYAVFETQTVVRPAYVVPQTAYGYGGYGYEHTAGYGGWGWRHRYSHGYGYGGYRGYGWRHHF